MVDFSGDEAACAFVALGIMLPGLFRWYGPLLSIPMLGRPNDQRLMLGMLPPLLLMITTLVLLLWSDVQVAGHVEYILLFLVVQAAWMTLACEVLRVLGISVRDDGIDRNNSAASVTACGFLAGIAMTFALSNAGGGPTIWTTILPALASAIALIGLWLIIEVVGGDVVECITIERDGASAFRLAGTMIGCGLVLGRAAGGNWVSWDQTWQDLISLGWPAMLIALPAALLQRLWKPTSSNPYPNELTRGICPAIVFGVAGVVIVACTPHGLHPAKW